MTPGNIERFDRRGRSAPLVVAVKSAAVGNPVAAAAVAGVAVGTAINQIPGVSEAVSDKMADGILLMGDTRKAAEKKARGVIDSFEEALDQLVGVSKAQDRVRKGTSDKLIDSTKKSEDRLKVETDREFLGPIEKEEDSGSEGESGEEEKE